MQHAKMSHPEFKLATVEGRIGLLAGITAGTVLFEEVAHAMIQDTEKRPHIKPVVVPNGRGGEVRFNSIRSAAAYLLRNECKTSMPTGVNYTRKLQAIEKRISRYCNADNVAHYYWSE